MGEYKPFSHKEAFAAGIAEPFQHHEMVAAGLADPVGRDDYSAKGSGGGSSDISIAKVTVVNNADDLCSLEAPVIAEIQGVGKATTVISESIKSGETSVQEVALYKGMAYGYASSVYRTTVEGNIELDDDGGLIIRGDGIVTVSSKSS